VSAARDWRLDSGERQTVSRFEDATASHRARYRWAANLLRSVPVRFGADVFCATGYGTAYLADEVGGVWSGWDGSADAIALGRRVHPRLALESAAFPCALPEGTMDAVVSIESIEHVEDDASFVASLTTMLRPGGHLLVSVPNEARIPCATFGNRWHVRHYTPESFSALFAGPMEQLGLALVATYGQRIHLLADTAWGPQRRGRVPEAEQDVHPDEAWASNPCTLLAHFQRVA
jgi:SAM-dependent methyltransferase